MPNDRIRRNQFPRSRQNAARLQNVLDAARAANGANIESADIEPWDDDMEEARLEALVPHTPRKYPAQGTPSIVVRWFHSTSSRGDFHTFSMSYPAGMTGALEDRIHDGIAAAHWRYDPAPHWRPADADSGGLYWHDGDGRETFSQLDSILCSLVTDVFHTGDAPDELAGHLSLHWKERSSQNYVRCTIADDGLSSQRRYQLRNVIERHDGFRNGQSLTFPQIYSGDIVADLQAAGFRVDETFSPHEPHYVEISEAWSLSIKGVIGQESWCFKARGNAWEICGAGPDPALAPHWKYGGIRPSSSTTFEETEQLIKDAIQRHFGGAGLPSSCET